MPFRQPWDGSKLRTGDRHIAPPGGFAKKSVSGFVNTSLTTAVITVCLFAAILLGRVLRRLLPEQHLTPDTKDAVKLAFGLVATMAAISVPLLAMVVRWLMVVFLSFSLCAPPNATASLALLVSACSVAGAFCLILELDRDHPDFQ